MSSATTPTKLAKSSQLSREEELLLKESSRNVSTKSSALFYGNATIISAIPICKHYSCSSLLFCSINKLINKHIKGLFWRIHQMEPLDFYIYYIIGTVIAAYLISFAYKNVKFVLKHKYLKDD